MSGNIPCNKSNMKETGENFILDYFSVDLEDLFKIDELNA